MKARRWPFEGDSPVARSRKVALAYRHMAKEQLEELELLIKVIGAVDPRIVEGWIDDPEFKRIYNNIRDQRMNGDRVEDLDRRFYEWGETWHADGLTRAFESDEWITAEEASGILQINRRSVSTMRARGRIQGKFVKVPGDHHGKWYYLASEIYRVQKEPRGRGVRWEEATDTVDAGGGSDAK